MEWFNGLSALEQVLFILASLASILLIIQFDGAGDGHLDGSDGHYDGDGCSAPSDIQSNQTSAIEIGGLKIVTVRGIVSFFAVGGWTAFLLYGVVGLWSLLIGAGAGAAVAVLLAFLMKSLMKLEGRGNISFPKAVGTVGTVYLTIPAARGGVGKITVMISERLVECEAMTDGGKIETGAVITVKGMVDPCIFLVERT